MNCRNCANPIQVGAQICPWCHFSPYRTDDSLKEMGPGGPPGSGIMVTGIVIFASGAIMTGLIVFGIGALKNLISRMKG